MIFDKASCLSLVKLALSVKDKKRTGDQELAMGGALDDLSLRLRSKSFLTSYDVTVADAARTKELRGDNDDLRGIFALKIGTGSTARVLEYRDPQQFLRTHDASDATAGKPNFFTILTASEGFPTVKFNIPLDGAETMTVYYYLELSPDNVSASRSIAAVTAGTLAYFYGIGEAAGVPYYAQFVQLASLSRASDTFTPETSGVFRLSKEDQAIRRTIGGIRPNRR